MHCHRTLDAVTSAAKMDVYDARQAKETWMAGFVPGRDRLTLESLHPDEARRLRALDSQDHQATLDEKELAELERAQTGRAARPSRPSLLDRLLRRR